MTLIEEIRRDVYTGNDAATVFSYNFKVFKAAEIKVFTFLIDPVSAVLIELLPSEFTLTGVGDVNGGTVTYPLSGSPLAPTHRIILLSAAAYDQELDVENQDGFHPETLELQLDETTVQIQQLLEASLRALRLSPGSNYSGSLELPDPLANAALAWNSVPDAIINGPTTAEIAAAAAHAATATAAAAVATAAAAAAIGDFAQYKTRDELVAASIGAVDRVTVMGGIILGDVTPKAYEIEGGAIGHPAVVTTVDGKRCAPTGQLVLEFDDFNLTEGSTDKLGKLNLMIDWLNEGNNRTAILPGRELETSATLNRINRDGARLVGQSPENSTLRMKAGGTGDILLIGSTTADLMQCGGVIGIHFVHDGSISGTEPLIVVDGVDDFEFRSNLMLSGAGCVRFGKLAKSIRVKSWWNSGNYDATLGGVGWTINDFTNFQSVGDRVASKTPSLTDKPVLHVKPINDNGDTLRMTGGEFFSNGMGVCAVFDYSEQFLVHGWINNMVFDQAQRRCVLITDDGTGNGLTPLGGGASTNKDLRNYHFNAVNMKCDDNQTDPSGYLSDRGLEILHDGGTGHIFDLSIQDCRIGFSDHEAVYTTLPSDQDKVTSVKIDSNFFVDVLPGVESPSAVLMEFNNAFVRDNIISPAVVQTGDLNIKIGACVLTTGVGVAPLVRGNSISAKTNQAQDYVEFSYPVSWVGDEYTPIPALRIKPNQQYIRLGTSATVTIATIALDDTVADGGSLSHGDVLTVFNESGNIQNFDHTSATWSIRNNSGALVAINNGDVIKLTLDLVRQRWRSDN